jgi:hypothetical protein
VGTVQESIANGLLSREGGPSERFEMFDPWIAAKIEECLEREKMAEYILLKGDPTPHKVLSVDQNLYSIEKDGEIMPVGESLVAGKMDARSAEAWKRNQVQGEGLGYEHPFYAD